jgi:hypothetical protein
MEDLLKQILAETQKQTAILQQLQAQATAANQTGQEKVGEADALLKNLLNNLPFNVKGVNDVN